MSAKGKGIIFMCLSAAMVSAAGPTLAKLLELGSQHPIHGRNPISFCNVLFAGDLIAVITLLFIFYRELKTFKPKSLNWKNWKLISLSAFISGCLSPSLYFLGIMYADIINVILISTLLTPMRLFAGWVFYREVPQLRTLLGSLLTIVGIFAAFFIQLWVSGHPEKTMLSPTEGALYSFLARTPYSGEMCILMAILLKTISMLINFHAVRTLPLGAFSVLSMFLGIIFFSFIVILTVGWSHFADIFSPFLWQWMLLYGGVIVGLRTYFKYIGMKYADVSIVVTSSSVVPLVSIFFAYLILGTLPGIAQILGGSLILAGLVLNIASKLKTEEPQKALEEKNYLDFQVIEAKPLKE
ncbi:DMT family transporter [Legionella israelensis]|nr:DMT family transporter [Legionella israelensis]